MEEKRAELIIKGRVQGVFFRASTRQKADDLGLAGWVRNLPLMRVEAVFQGPEEAVEQAITWCWQGPPGAQVQDIRVSWTTPEAGLRGFTVRY